METDFLQIKGLVAEININLVLQARARRCGVTESESIKQVPQEQIYAINKMLSTTACGARRSAHARRIVKLIFLQKANAEPEKGIRSYKVVAVTVTSKW